MASNKKSRKGRKSGNHHHNFFVASFQNGTHVKALLKLAFSRTQLQIFDLRTIRLDRCDWIDSALLKRAFADLVVSVCLKDGPRVAVTVVIEHKSAPERHRIMSQLLRYQSLIYDQPQTRVVLPPIVVYHGRQLNWPKWRTFQQFQLDGLPKHFTDAFAGDMLDFGVQIINLREQAVRRQVAKLPLDDQLALQAMADVWDADEHKLAEWFDKSRVLPESVREDLMRRILVYLLKVHSEIKLNTMIDTVKARSQEDQIMKKLAKEWSWLTEEEIMDRCRQEGIDQGRDQGIEQGAEQVSRRIAERMIRKGISDQTVSECTDLPLDEVTELRNGH